MEPKAKATHNTSLPLTSNAITYEISTNNKVKGNMKKEINEYMQQNYYQSLQSQI
jgi:hypothetical protein